VITLADIICAVEDEPIDVRQPSTSLVQDMTQKLWDTMNAKVLDFAGTVTLKSLVLDQLAMGAKIEGTPPVKRGMLKRPDRSFDRPNGPNSVFELSRTPWVHG
jgi:hypothetical protein